MSRLKAAQSFWMWFMCHEKVYLNFNDLEENKQEEWLEELLEQLKKYNKGFGFGLNLAHGPYAELVISAKGNYRLFNEVIFLTTNAPVIENWDFVNFFYETDVTGAFTYKDAILYPDDIYFSARRNNRRLGLLDLQLFITASKATRQSESLNDAINLLLLHQLGETNFATTIGSVSVRDAAVGLAKKRLHKLRELPDFVSTRNVVKSLLPAMLSQGAISFGY